MTRIDSLTEIAVASTRKAVNCARAQCAQRYRVVISFLLFFTLLVDLLDVFKIFPL